MGRGRGFSLGVVSAPMAHCPFVIDWNGTRPGHVCGLATVRGNYCAAHAEVMYRRETRVDRREIRTATRLAERGI